MTPQPELMQGIAPIFGNERCCFISGKGHVSVPLYDFGSQLGQGFTLAIDVQPEVTQPSILLGTGSSSKTSLVIRYNADDVRNQMRLDLRDDDGRMLSASVQLSTYAAKRLFVLVDPQQNFVKFHELNLLPTTSPAQTVFLKQESPRSFSNFTYPMIVGGACIDGERQGKIATKLANFIVGSKILQEKNLKTLFDAHWQQLKQFNSGALYLVDENPERRAIFQDDMRKLKEWVRKPHLSGAETRDAAILLYRWLLDKHPMLQDLCNELGIQLTLPGYSEKRRSRYEMDVFNTAIFGLPLEIGKGISFGYQWVTRDKFSRDVIMIIKGTRIQVGSFIKFVRNKLGGGHFDTADRKKWQKELAVMTEYYNNDRDFLNHMMKQLLRSVWEGVWENRIEQHATRIWRS